MNKNKVTNWFFIVSGLILIGISLSFFCIHSYISDGQKEFDNVKRKYYPVGNKIKDSFDLTNDSYLLKIKYEITPIEKLDIYFNGVRVVANTYHFNRKREHYENFYIHLPRKTVKQGDNTLEIVSDHSLPEVIVVLRNYRKYFNEGFYLLFTDSTKLDKNRTFLKTKSLINSILLLLGTIAYIKGRNISQNKYSAYFIWLKYLLSKILILLLLIFWICLLLGYRLILTHHLMIQVGAAIFIAWMIFEKRLITKFFINLVSLVGKINFTEFFFKERRLNFVSFMALFSSIIFINLLVYWPSFFHIFRHDEWFLFFSSRIEPANLSFIIKHLNWQLLLPYDRVNFRPVFTTSLAINRVLFDTNYIGPHILAFTKHILATFLLWLIMWRKKKALISALFALAFSLLVTGIDCVIWPHVDSYITTTIFLLLALLIFSSFLEGRISLIPAFTVISVLIFIGILTTQLFLVVPFIFAFHLFVINKTNTSKIRYKKSILLFLFAPLFLWGLCFLFHLYLAYPFNMTSQSGSIAIWEIIPNIVKFVFVVFTAAFFPFSVQVNLSDKIYIIVSFFYLLVMIAIFCVFKLFKNNLILYRKKEVLLFFSTAFSTIAIICLTRANYIDSHLSRFALPSYCIYTINALLVLILFYSIAWDKLNKYRGIFLILIYCIILINATKVYSTSKRISYETKPIKSYFDSVKDFVESHKKEPDFSFKLIDRPPNTEIFPWYHQTAIDGLFYQFINYDTPKYLLEYDYGAEILKSNLCNNTEFHNIIESENVDTSAVEADFTNSIGMKFKKISFDQKRFLMGIYEVTQQQWQNVMGYNPSKFKNDWHPVENVSYYMVQKFIDKLNKIEGTDLYRLPTEQEYRAVLSLGAEKNIVMCGWLNCNSDEMTHAIASIESCRDGFYDFIGNVWEWTQTPIHPGSPTHEFESNPRICFGGSWRDNLNDYKNLTTNYPPDFHHEHLGFRMVKEISTD